MTEPTRRSMMTSAAALAVLPMIPAETNTELLLRLARENGFNDVEVTARNDSLMLIGAHQHYYFPDRADPPNRSRFLDVSTERMLLVVVPEDATPAQVTTAFNQKRDWYREDVKRFGVFCHDTWTNTVEPTEPYTGKTGVTWFSSAA